MKDWSRKIVLKLQRIVVFVKIKPFSSTSKTFSFDLRQCSMDLDGPPELSLYASKRVGLGDTSYTDRIIIEAKVNCKPDNLKNESKIGLEFSDKSLIFEVKFFQNPKKFSIGHMIMFKIFAMCF